MSRTTQAIEFAQGNRDRYLSELKEYLAITSVSTLPAHKPDIQRAAEWLSRQMTSIGLRYVEIMPTAGHPVVYGERLGAPGKPTVLVYGHYDVQPVDPLNEWVSPPFEPTIRGDNIYARGVSDNKGNAHAFLKALEAWSKVGALPLNVKVMVEGEEEIGSPHLEPFIEQHKEKLACDFVLNVDAGMLKPDLPSLTYGLRGLAYFEIWVQGPAHDLHSGVFGVSVHNPAQALCELIAGMHDADGHITLPGFYDQVRVLSAEERAELAKRFPNLKTIAITLRGSISASHNTWSGVLWACPESRRDQAEFYVAPTYDHPHRRPSGGWRLVYGGADLRLAHLRGQPPGGARLCRGRFLPKALHRWRL